MENNKYLLIIIGMGLVTYGARVLPLFIFKNRKLNENVLKWMRYIPVTILSALIAPNIFMPDGNLQVSFSNPYILASAITALAALKIKNLVGIVVIGMMSILIFKII